MIINLIYKKKRWQWPPGRWSSPCPREGEPPHWPVTSAPISPHPLHLMAGDVKTRRLAINLINSKYLFFLSNVLGKPALGHTVPSKQCQSLSLLRLPSTPVTASCAHLSHHILHVKGHRQIVNRSNRLAQAAETQRFAHFESNNFLPPGKGWWRTPWRSVHCPA